MTAQIQNSISFDDKKYSIIALQNELDFEPTTYGIDVDTGCSMCWRGYYCIFGIEKEQLVLKNWHILSKSKDEPPIIEKVQAVRKNGMWYYTEMNYQMQYSGGMVIGTGFIEKYYIHMGYQKVYAYETVIELIFENGKLVEKIDHSEMFENVRNTIDVQHRELKDHIFENIGKMFSLRYEDKFYKR